MIGFDDKRQDNKVKPLGKVQHNIIVDGEIFFIESMVVPSSCVDVDVVLGEDFCLQAEITISCDGVIIRKLKNLNEEPFSVYPMLNIGE